MVPTKTIQKRYVRPQVGTTAITHVHRVCRQPTITPRISPPRHADILTEAPIQPPDNMHASGPHTKAVHTDIMSNSHIMALALINYQGNIMKAVPCAA